MVHLANFRPINVSEQEQREEAARQHERETLEAQEARLVAAYEHALQQAARNATDAAVKELRQLLKEPLLAPDACFAAVLKELQAILRGRFSPAQEHFFLACAAMCAVICF
ncbi:hypothetical protein DUNSADRAFT_16433 [Dunaliella salina]|uniref:Uncharacterized protein n=1 Tax=Dunaliella salina TaxID=3046 RepID=A0ABQ7G3K6_DUNSA|nr:hypothetical protein DUNSADRAFT_16433 [Dunaliella salina]|eukprot:KAF5829188.1 hypothetical protein DUNSADRAFT_16433 [Dunaliella salina]